MAYKHGTYQTEAASDINLPVTLDYGHFIVGMAPIHKVKKGKRKKKKEKRRSKERRGMSWF